MSLLSVSNLSIVFKTPKGEVKAVNDVSFNLEKGETLALVGESGSGKTVTSLAIMGLEAGNARIRNGSILYHGQDLLALREKELRRIRGSGIAMIFQDPLSFLDPIARSGKQVMEAIKIAHKEKRNEALSFLRRYRNLVEFSDVERALSSVMDWQNRAVCALEAAEKGKAYHKLRRILDEYPLGPQFLSKEVCGAFSAVFSLRSAIKGAKKEICEAEAIYRKEGVPFGDYFKLSNEARTKTDPYICLKEDIEKKYFLALKKAKEAVLSLHPSSPKNVYAELTALRKEKEAIAKKKYSKAEAKKKTIELFECVGIDRPLQRFAQYPFELSGGMRQRVMIAMALAGDPEILICDEPTTALDVSTQASILTLLDDLKRERKLSILFITHDLGVVAHVADRVHVMYCGRIIERGRSEEVFYDPRHPYTWCLLSSLPELDYQESLTPIKGCPPNQLEYPIGDPFFPRNPYSLAVDEKIMPPEFEISPTHYAASWLLDERAPTVEAPELVKSRIALYLADDPRRKPSPTLMKNSLLRDLSIGKKKAAKKSSADFGATLIEVNALTKRFALRKSKAALTAVSNVSFKLRRGEVLCLVGESGSGKSTTSLMVAGLLKPDEGNIVYPNGRPNIQMIFQDSYLSLDPRLTIYESIVEGLLIKGEKDQRFIDEKVRNVCRETGVPMSLLERYPSQLSGGQRQRVCIARALIVDPDVLIADEPISALDVSIQAQIINLLNTLKKRRNISILFVAHNLSVVAYFADTIAVMNQGLIVEYCSKDDLFKRPLHPYSKNLLEATPVPNPIKEKGRLSHKFIMPSSKGKLREITENHFAMIEEEKV